MAADMIPEGFELESPEDINLEEWELEPEEKWQENIPTIPLYPAGKAAARAIKGAASLHPISLAVQLYDMLSPEIKAKILDVEGGIPAKAAFVKPGEEVSHAYDKLFGLEPNPTDPLERTAESFGEYAQLVKNLPAKSVQGAHRLLSMLGKSLGLTAGEEAVRSTVGEEFVPAYKIAAPLGVAGLAAAASGKQAGGKTTLATSLENNPELKELYDYGKSIGMTEKELTPVLQSTGKSKIAGAVASPTERAHKSIAEAKEALGKNYDKLRAQGRSTVVPQRVANNLVTDLGNVRTRLQSPHIVGPDSEAVIKRIDEGINRIAQNPGDATTIMDTYRELNSIPNWNAMQDGRRRLAEVRDMYKDVLNKIDPRIGKEFDLTNRMYQNLLMTSKNIGVKGNPAMYHALNVTPILTGLGIGGIHGGMAALAGVIGKEATQRIATELLINPKLQGLHRNILRSLQSSSPEIKIKAFKDLMTYLDRDHPEEALKIREAQG